MKTSPTFDRAISAAMSAASKSDDISAVPFAPRTVALVHAAQGVIDNGGLQYFFESDFPGNPPYSIFIDAYGAIGAADAADTLAKAVALFPFTNPHLDVKKRNRFLDSFLDEDDEPANSPFEPLSKKLCGNKSVWENLRQFIDGHAKELGV